MLLVWNGRPTRQIGELIAEIEGDVSGALLRELAAASSEDEFWEIADRIQASQHAFETVEDRGSSSSTFHIGFFCGSVQVSFGERGFVPLSNLLDYSPHELMTYMSERRRIELPRRTAGWSVGDGPMH